MGPRIRIHTKMSWIRNTEKYDPLQYVVHALVLGILNNLFVPVIIPSVNMFIKNKQVFVYTFC